MSKKEAVLTIDVDWAPEEMIADTLQLLDDYGVVATFFCTHKSDLLLAQKKHELGIHPNFIPLIEGKSDRSKEQIVDELLNIYPDSKGVRAHGLVQSSGIMNMYLEKGLKYDSNLLLPYERLNKYVFDIFSDFKRNVYNWSDDIHLMYRTNELKFNPNEEVFEDLSIMAFHPFHIFANTTSMEHYASIKNDYQNASKIKSVRNQQNYGVRTYFNDMLNNFSANGIKFKKLEEVI